MYNLNVNLATTAAPGNLLGVETGCTTPRTPEILNSLIAMTNPLDNYNFGDDAPKTAAGPPTSLSSCGGDSNSSTSRYTESQLKPSKVPAIYCTSSAYRKITNPFIVLQGGYC